MDITDANELMDAYDLRWAEELHKRNSKPTESYEESAVSQLCIQSTPSPSSSAPEWNELLNSYKERWDQEYKHSLALDNPGFSSHCPTDLGASYVPQSSTDHIRATSVVVSESKNQGSSKRVPLVSITNMNRLGFQNPDSSWEDSRALKISQASTDNIRAPSIIATELTTQGSSKRMLITNKPGTVPTPKGIALRERLIHLACRRVSNRPDVEHFDATAWKNFVAVAWAAERRRKKCRPQKSNTTGRRADVSTLPDNVELTMFNSPDESMDLIGVETGDSTTSDNARLATPPHDLASHPTAPTLPTAVAPLFGDEGDPSTASPCNDESESHIFSSQEWPISASQACAMLACVTDERATSPTKSGHLKRRRESRGTAAPDPKRFHADSTLPCATDEQPSYPAPATSPSPLKHPRKSVGAEVLNPKRLHADAERYLAQRGIVLTADLKSKLQEASTTNVPIRGEAKSGKTLLAETIAVNHARADNRVLFLVRNQRVEAETKERLGRARVHVHIDVFTPTGLVQRLFPEHPDAYKQDALDRVRKSRKAPGTPQLLKVVYGHIVIDEFQDWTEPMYWLLVILLTGLHRVTGISPLLALCGDPRQATSGYRGGDTRFLELSPTLFPSSPHGWKSILLRRNHIISHSMALFVNQVYVDGLPYLHGSHHGLKPRFYHVSPGKDHIESAAKHLLPLILEHKNSCALAAPSTKPLKDTDPLYVFANFLTASGVTVGEAPGEGMPLTTGRFYHQVVMANYSQLQGTQFDLIIVFGSDWGPDGLLVPLTRASQVAILHFMDHPAPGGFSWTQLSKYAAIEHIPPLPPHALHFQPKPQIYHPLIPRRLAVTDLGRNVDGIHLEALIKKNGISCKEVTPRLPLLRHFDPPQEISSNPTDPDNSHSVWVADINGIVVPRALEFHLQTASLGYPCPPDLPIRDLIQAALKEKAERSGSPTYSGPPCRPIQPGEELQFEQSLPDLHLDAARHSVTIQGCADIVVRSPLRICEVKLVSELTAAHKVQALAYTLQLAKSSGEDVLPRTTLHNVRTGQTFELGGTVVDTENLLVAIILAQFSKRKRSTEEEFLKMCAQTRAEVKQTFDSRV
ncbi:hypothetical protein B0H17DRAFT_1184220 [Mycena rosella]|uniref:DNA helicase n=1 Tax=Mycena rosella TaxID=1033263 RepID=A0AAD7G4P0_MYCRO|nr:hypothetical protein B0H17DRAFT_1184220 [Mycena rosella]